MKKQLTNKGKGKMKPGKTFHEELMEDPEGKRYANQEDLILDVTEKICDLMEKNKISRVELANRLGKTKGFVTQILSHSRNLTLRTLADIATALECKVNLQLEKSQEDGYQRKYEYKNVALNFPKKKIPNIVNITSGFPSIHNEDLMEIAS